jgi:hypothetical protein
MKRILSFKHWQLFILIFIAGAWVSPSPLKEIVHSISIVSFSIWIYSIGVYGHDRIQQLGLPAMNLKLFKVNALLVPVLLFVALFFVAKQTEDTNATSNLLTIIFTPITLYLFFAIFQTVIFACKTLATLELKREVIFSDYSTNLLLMIFIFVGVWILQPKITRLIADNDIATAN